GDVGETQELRDRSYRTWSSVFARDNGFEIIHGIKRDYRGQMQFLGVTRADQRDDVAAGRLAGNGDAFQIHLVLPGILFHVTDGLDHVVHRGWVAVVRRQAVVDAEPREARLRERIEQRLAVFLLVAVLPAAAMHHDHGGKRTLAVRNPGVELQAYAAHLAVFYVGLQTRGGCHAGRQDREQSCLTHE